jgi:hypothetical protein
MAICDGNRDVLIPPVCQSKGLRSVAEGWIYSEAPHREQPLRDVDTIPVLFAPGPQLRRRGVPLWCKVQLPDLQFEFSDEHRDVRNGTPPIGISAFASHK